MKKHTCDIADIECQIATLEGGCGPQPSDDLFPQVAIDRNNTLARLVRIAIIPLSLVTIE